MGKLAGNEWLAKTLVLQANLAEGREALHAAGFEPAFFDCVTCTTYPSRHADGSPAAGHVLDGLPDELVVVRSDCGRVLAARASLTPGYERHGYFYTPSAARRSVAEWGCTA